MNLFIFKILLQVSSRLLSKIRFNCLPNDIQCNNLYSETAQGKYSWWSLNAGSIRFIEEGLLYQNSGLLKQVIS